MNCIIIDDEKLARTVIKTLCKEMKSLQIVDEFPNALQAIKFLNENEIDLIFLDIHMPDFTGFDFVKTLKNPPQVILTTSDPNFALEAFQYECIVDYLLKPVTFDRFERAIQKVVKKKALEVKSLKNERKETYSNDFYVNIDRRLIKIDLPSIYLIEAKGDYINIKTDDKNYIVHSTLKKIEEKLPDSLFLKVHRSYIINLKKIIDIEDNSVLIKRDVVPVSRSKRPELMKRLNLL
ncbi:LytR/AlgR family response regulator transcription factor [Tenacibaculum maritimum]|uniref:LytR/AlgR family response regulator transcription factor n=1 Tax=Tenacibaculum maritimum TaxID=107401 RepID=UPI0012E5F4AA|nr:LytTR family DNA-binding domain-containing protein [Tenacibaculum maritimum]MCD9582043.1 LytTR family DNA-binding domain-containing protein [Tenacibaculum maritimum]MCD9636240.1 LytTR family DNA-binding domain-containing protein [Tenacibaculum maritimum]CAA0194947.1 Two-component system response regulatory protein, LytTR family [Tenacibaculum maritimum]CAA0227289.1 Two-component system response regulatory protein, LytTR family [Tenacibaculum maritimum]CAA0228042.1 Two-component system respo